MKKTLTQKVLLSFAVGGLLFAPIPLSWTQQVADPNFDTNVAHPVYTKNPAKVLFDEAHFNFHTADGRYKPFADLIRNDGYQVMPNREKFQKNALQGYAVLVIANALGADKALGPAAKAPAFTEAECAAVEDWVRQGGALLLIADHAPFGAAAENLAQRFGVEMSKGYTQDSAHYDKASGNETVLVYSHANGLLGDHAITRGRDASERLQRVITFTGQSLKGPEGSIAFLKLADTATDIAPPSEADIRAAREKAQRADRPAVPLPGGPPIPPGATVIQMPLPQGAHTSAAGRTQGLALPFGKGRVVVLGEAALLSAQLAGPEKKPFGMNRPGIDNRQLALNIMHWLSRVLGE